MRARIVAAVGLVFGFVTTTLTVPASAHPLVPTIGPGSTNQNGVICVQSALNLVAGRNLEANGIYNAETEQAVRDLQAYMGMPVHGLVDQLTGGVIGYFVDLRAGDGTWRDDWSCFWVVPSEGAPPQEGPFPYHLPLPYESLPRDGWAKPHHNQNVAIDLMVPSGTPVFAMTSGSTYSNGFGGDCGGHIRLLGVDGIRYSYCHLSRVLISNGQHVERGQLIGYSGATGNASGPHLHLEIFAWGLKRCPGPMLLALYDNFQPYAPQALPTTGCTGGGG